MFFHVFLVHGFFLNIKESSAIFQLFSVIYEHFDITLYSDSLYCFYIYVAMNPVSDFGCSGSDGFLLLNTLDFFGNMQLYMNFYSLLGMFCCNSNEFIVNISKMIFKVKCCDLFAGRVCTQ